MAKPYQSGGPLPSLLRPEAWLSIYGDVGCGHANGSRPDGAVLPFVDLAGGVYQLFQLVVDLGAIQLLQGLTTPQHRRQALGIETQYRFARVLAEEVLGRGLGAGGRVEAGKHQQIIGRVFGQVAGQFADLQAGDALLLLRRRQGEGEKQLVDGGVIKRVH